MVPMACVTKKKKSEVGPIGKAYHNTTAYYNGYWNSKELMKENLKLMRAANTDDYNKILEVEDFIAIDNPRMVKNDMDTIIAKVTTVAQLHELSDWVDDCYVMMAKAQYMKQDYETAEETLEYFQEDFNPSNPYGRNYKSKKPSGKAAKKIREEEKKEKEKADKKEKEERAALKEKEAEEREKMRKEEKELREEKAKVKEAEKKVEAKTKAEEKKERDKAREKAKKDKEKQRKEDIKNRKKGNTSAKPKTQAVPATDNVPVSKPAATTTSKPVTKPAESPKIKDKPTEEKKEEKEISNETKPAKPQEEDKTAYSEGLLWLAKTYIKRENWFAAEMLLQKLENSAVNKDLQSDIPATYATLCIKQKRYDEALVKLEKAIDLEDNKQLKARYAFIAGQICQMVNQFAKAKDYFLFASKKTNNYKMGFMSELAISKNGIKSGNITKEMVVSKMTKMLGEDKYSDVKDQIYFTLAEIEFSQNNFESAIENYKKSIAFNATDQKLKAESYYKVAGMYNDSEKYLEASAYYDTTLSLLTSKDERYAQVQRYASNLKDIATNIETIKSLDTLVYFASLDDDARKKIIPDWLKRNKKDVKYAGSGNIVTKQVVSKAIDFGNSSFFAYNNTAKMRGKEEFNKIWQGRPLEDDWRRRNKVSSGVSESQETQVAESTGEPDDFNKEEYNKFLRELPTNPIKKREVNDRIQNAMFTLGKLFRDKIENYKKSASTLEEMHQRFDDIPQEKDSWFYLYLDYVDMNDMAKAESYKSKLLNKYPGTEFADILTKPVSQTNEKAQTSKADEWYNAVYTQFEKRNYDAALQMIEKAEPDQPEDNPNKAKIALLKAMCIGGIKGKEAYVVSLNDVIKKYPSTPEQSKAKEILRFLGGDQNAFQEVKDVDNIYQREQNTTHYVLVITYNLPDTQYLNLKIAIDAFSNKNFKLMRLNIGESSLDNNNTQIILVRRFENEEKAIEYYKKATKESDEFAGNLKPNYDIFVASQANYRKLLSEHSAASYRVFFEKNIMPDILK
jgi:tetratricopeptide (TPR) repeat protein